MKLAKLRQDQADFFLFLNEANMYVDLCMYVLFYAPFDLALDLRTRYNEPRFRPFLDASREVNIYQVLNDFLHYLLDTSIAGPHDNLVIYRWSDNWDIYFNIGKEWWGTFFWTILNKSNKTITIISASASD